jgi:hypothetical protein
VRDQPTRPRLHYQSLQSSSLSFKAGPAPAATPPGGCSSTPLGLLDDFALNDFKLSIGAKHSGVDMITRLAPGSPLGPAQSRGVRLRPEAIRQGAGHDVGTLDESDES